MLNADTLSVAAPRLSDFSQPWRCCGPSRSSRRRRSPTACRTSCTSPGSPRSWSSSRSSRNEICNRRRGTSRWPCSTRTWSSKCRYKPSPLTPEQNKLERLSLVIFIGLFLIACQGFKVFFLVGDEKQNTKHFSLSLTGEK